MRIEEPDSGYGEEVLNAGWTPQPQLGLQLREAEPTFSRVPVADVDAFLAAVYRNQE